METQFVEPSPAGKAFLVTFIAFVILGALSFERYWPQLRTYILALPPCQMVPWLYGCLLVLVFMLWIPAAWIAWFSTRAIRSGQMPPPGTWVIHRTPIRRGPAAVIRGRVLLFLAMVLALIPFWFVSILHPLLIPAMERACVGT